MKFPTIDTMQGLRGKKAGEVRVFREGDSGKAFMWNEEAGGYWEPFGVILTGPKKKSWPGDNFFPKGEYDYIYDVELGGKHMKFPYNDGQDTMRVAEKFIARERIGLESLTQIQQHIRNNSKNLPYVPEVVKE